MKAVLSALVLLGVVGGVPLPLFAGNTTLTVSVTGGVTSVCNDGLDNDSDGLTDYPDDPGCTGAVDEDEFNTAPPAATATPPLGGGAPGLIGGTGFTPLNALGAISFSGNALPGGVVSVLSGGVLKGETVASPTGSFSITLSSLPVGFYSFLLIASDEEGASSASIPVALSVVAQVTTSVSGIEFGPTIGQSDTVIERGSSVYVFGYSSPTTRVRLVIDGEEFEETLTSPDGSYGFIFDTTSLVPSLYSLQTESVLDRKTSKTLSLLVIPSRVTPRATETCALRGDINLDCRVSVADFSIAAFWYLKANPPRSVDLNGDGVVSVPDFSIMMSNWTG